MRLSFHPRRLAATLAVGAISLAASLAPPALAPVSAKVFDPETFTLDNGLEVVVIANSRAPIVTHMVWYRVGAADEPPGKSGIAHFLEHLMFKGTETMAPGEFSEIIARNGGQENAFTSWDYTAYFQTIAKDRLELMMRFEADRMANLRLSDAVVDPERDVILEERRSRTDNEPGAQLSEMVTASLFLNHPYGIPIIGWEHEMRGLTTEDALAFYERWYAPNNAILVVAGDVTAEEVRGLAERYYGVIPARDLPDRVRPSEPKQLAPRRVTLESPRVRQPSLWIDYLAPSYGAGASEHAYPLQVLDEILGGGTTSRLYRRLVVEQAVAAGAGSGYGAGSVDLTNYRFYVTPRPGIELDAAEAALRAQIEALLESGVTEEEVAAAKTRMRSSAIYARDSLSTGANILGRSLATGQSVEDVESWPERIEAVTAEQVNAAARAVFDARRSVTGVLLPKPTS
ncbi:MAG: insulinase family protein [Kiloniellales bacterium]|nr:insulinase family protein [Kiloniellales bacterium]